MGLFARNTRMAIASSGGLDSEKPTATPVRIGDEYYATDTGILYRCVVIGAGGAVWWAPAAGWVGLGADGNISLSGSGAWDDWTTSSWLTSGLVGFEHSGGVLTYSGPGEIVTVTFIGAAITVTSGRNVSVGISVTNGEPETGRSILINLPQTYPRAMMCSARVTLTSGTDLRIKFSSAASDTLTLSTGSAMIVTS